MEHREQVAPRSSRSLLFDPVVITTNTTDWTQAIPVGNVTSVTPDIAKDNLQFGVRAVDKAGHRSPVGFPVTVTT
jgi:hypothetical protein